ncbi:Uncharacterised protein [Legionella lansingensis]|uniref:Protein kinase domain-containing protein n=2 Tax=Legionella lansingensis TaxID=45067 RepID=A0A0W0VZ69_9GAMM|nr:hypothetical protein Llan_0165 [Legionella lansingensis]SNV51410.1 Uncharacterised protein [Legionella lansingensis]
MSFLDYKIDYNKCLGSGVFGTVYEVVPRPENEKGFFSYWFPYAYDYLFRVGPIDREPSQYCVKISKTALRIVYENPNHPFRYRLAWHSLFEAAKEEKTNGVLRKYSLSNICFFKTNSIYSQFKTQVHGKTLHDYIEKGIFVSSEQFMLRKSFVDFLHKIKNPKFTFWELHENNLMYDEQNNCWEIVDGIFNEIDDTNIEKRKDNLRFFLDHLLQSSASKEVHYWLEALVENAYNDDVYTEKQDEEIRQSIESNSVNSFSMKTY